MQTPTFRGWPDVPRSLLLAGAVAALEGLGTIGFGLAEAVHTTSARATMGVTTALFFVAYGALVLLGAWGISRANSWARGPVLITQLFALGLAWNFRDHDTVMAAVALAVPAVVVLVAVLRPESIAALENDDRPD